MAIDSIVAEVRQAREACRLEPENGLYFNTLGVALFRAGQYQEALERLTRSEKLNTATFKAPQPADLAFVRAVYEALGARDDFHWREVLELVEQKPEIARLNAHVQQRAP